MKSFARPPLLLLCFVFALLAPGLMRQDAQAEDLRLAGAGGTFPYLIYSAWFQQFSKNNPSVQVDYQGLRSGAGIQSFINNTIDFGGSDVAMTDEQIAQVKDGAVLIPMAAGTIVIGYNLPGITDLKLPREVYPEIFLGKITRWNDPKIVAANPNLTLPDLPITVFVRSDSSGTTYVFTRHLSAIAPAFASEVGSGQTVSWPIKNGTIAAAPRNDGVAALIKRLPGSIGYIEYSYAKFANINIAMLENKAGNYIQPSTKSGEAALADAKLDPELRGWVDDPEGTDAYPITTFSWLLFYKKQEESKAKALRDLVAYCASEPAQTLAEKMGYIPLPADVIAKIKEATAAIK